MTDSAQSLELCGERSNEALLSDGNEAQLHFRSDASVTNRGFYLSHQAVPDGKLHLPCARVSSRDISV